MTDSRLELRVFGSPLILFNGLPLDGLSSRTAEALLIYLACQDGPASREFLAEFLWSERTQEQALANLRSILSSLRKNLEAYLLVTRQTVTFNRTPDFGLDLAEFEAQMQACLHLIHATQLPKDAEIRLEKALSLYRGDFLEGFYLREGRGFEEWVTLTRERFRRLAHTGFRRLVHHYLETHQYLKGIEMARRLIVIDPFDEEARRQIMWLLARHGQRNQALLEYETLRKLLKEELGVTPAPTTSALYERFRALTFPPRHNLPMDTTPFIGRDIEIAELLRLLGTPGFRLVTLLGPGGIGKTRLGVEVVRRMIHLRPGQFLEGVSFVSLVEVNSPHHIPLAIADALDLTFQGPTPATKQLLAYLQHKEILLVLDDFERFISAGQSQAIALLVSILADAPKVKLLLTSRERLNLYEEIVFDVPGLALPDQESVSREHTSAVALFLQTVRRTQSAFAPSAGDLDAIVRVCQLLQGVPLAIELAASWGRQYSPGQMVQHIETSLDFLQAGFRNVPDRHRSLRAVFDHSWELLTPSEQAIFCQLAIFEGGFTMESAAAVVSDPFSVFSTEKTNPWKTTTENWLASLSDKSLLQRHPDGRYTLHTLLRQFAAEKQAEFTGMLEAIPQHHADYYFKLVARLDNGEGKEERILLRTELANIRAAWAWAVQKRDFFGVGTVLAVLYQFFSIQSWFQEGVELFDFAAIQFIGFVKTPETATIVCDLLGKKARMHIHIGQLDLARRTLDQAQTFLQQIDVPEQRQKTLDALAISYFYAGEFARAADIAEEILHYAEQTQNSGGIAFAVNFWGSCAKALGDYGLASTLFERAVAAYETMEDHVGAAMVLNNLGNLELVRKNYSAARGYYHQSRQLFQLADHIHGAATALANEGKLALQERDYAAARDLLTESLHLKQKMNDQRGVALALAGLGDLACETQAFSDAQGYFSQALSQADTSGDVRLVMEVLVSVAGLFMETRGKEKAASLLAFVQQHPALTQEARDKAEKIAEHLPRQKSPHPDMSLETIVESTLRELRGSADPDHASGLSSG